MTVTISLSGDGFTLTVPSANGAGPHDVQVPGTLSGLSIIRKVLTARAQAQAAYEMKIGFTASPTQAQVEAWLSEDRRVRAAEKTATERAVDQGVLSGLNLGELDL